jgi:hypothetical protein
MGQKSSGEVDTKTTEEEKAASIDVSLGPT